MQHRVARMLPLPLVRESEPSGAVVIGSHVRPVEELKTAMLRGNKLRKYGRRGKPKDHLFRLSQDLQELQWDSSSPLAEGKARHGRALGGSAKRLAWR
ncbi:hypothetical protein MNEG_10734 [Monoraphidium neglectum]|uniref:Uncharacterized protein n=1 Tax=Monoraphidium neglectum TaxID=145388 RepID=A0A0D2M0S2_9CHLO|nr:hypothetical protein MNEG_10734 [Monoraphidium neglectum]KIY97229.1 hypothetical protein MNEG_10734 [Monoraphidium neglectum]|eukprot:XP_013896249.1 hypothetical protein MNEG_10734 [Monoraphidium neglectum]